MFSRVVSLLLLLSLGTDSYALRQTGLEQSPAARQSLLSALSAGAEEIQEHLVDDATGGAELSLAHALAGGSALLVNEKTDRALFRQGYSAILRNTQTRNSDPPETLLRVSGLKSPPLQEGQWSYFKMDSTLRGNWLDAIQARARGLQPDLILIAPALPSQGRITVGGVQGIRDGAGIKPLHQTLYRGQMDPVLVKAGSNLAEYLAKRGVRPVERMDLGRASMELLQRRLSSLQAGTTVLFDATDPKHLDLLAAAVRGLRRPVLCCGAAGWYEALVSGNPRVPPEPWVKQLQESVSGGGKILVVVGSGHPVSVEQVERAVEDLPDRVERMTISPDRLKAPRDRRGAIRETPGKILKAWSRKQAVILQVDSPAALRPGRGLQKQLSEFFSGVLKNKAVWDSMSLLVVVGGDTLDTVLRSFQGGFVATGQVGPQIPYGRLQAPDRASLPMVTKAGGFGGKGWLSDLLRKGAVLQPKHIGITMGDPAGSGPELLLRALAQEPKLLERARILVIGDAAVLEKTVSFFGIQFPGGLDIRPIQKTGEAEFAPGILNVLDLGNVDLRMLMQSAGPVGVSDLDERTRRHFGKAALEYLDAGIELASSGAVDGLVTLPVTKEDVALVDPGFRGHTERLGERLGTLSGSGEVSIALIHGNLRVLHVTTHRSLKEAAEFFQTPAATDRILELIRVADRMGSRYFGLAEPRIGVLGLNPHAGEGGLLGSEDKERIQPAIDRALEEGLNVEKSPIPGDAAFTPGIREQYDFLIAMYHDQGHAPFKALAGFGGINFTGNLAKVRTTPDHGTDRRNAYNPLRARAPSPEGVIASIHSAIAMISAERLSAGVEELGLPGVALPRELWDRFEQQMQAQAALEVAA